MASEFLQQLVEEREKERKKVLASDPAYKEILEEVLVHLRTMRDTWKEVMKLAHSK